MLKARSLIPASAQTQYGHVWRLDTPTQASGHFRWPTAGGKTTLGFEVSAEGVTVTQDGALLGASKSPTALPVPKGLGQLKPSVCSGIYGPCPAGVVVEVNGLG